MPGGYQPAGRWSPVETSRTFKPGEPRRGKPRPDVVYLTLRGSGVGSHSKQTATAHKPLELWTVACSAQMTFKARRFEKFP